MKLRCGSIGRNGYLFWMTLENLNPDGSITIEVEDMELDELEKFCEEHTIRNWEIIP